MDKRVHITPTVSPFGGALRDITKDCWDPFLESPENFSGEFRVTHFSLYLQNKDVSRHETLQLFLIVFPLQHIKTPALQNKRVAVLEMAFRARKVLGTFEKRAPAKETIPLFDQPCFFSYP